MVSDETKSRKRGRPARTKATESPKITSQPHSLDPSPTAETRQPKSRILLKASPTQKSPPKSTQTNKVIKQLPTVRDHTTDQLGPEGDEYIPREFDEAGEKKVTATGHLMDGRDYLCRTFFVPNRGDKLFMLATECARVLTYRDSYLLFNKNRSLFKIIASQAEKDDLIAQEILPYSYRSRQIAIVTAKSMYRQFGSRMIINGRKVRDDYWESKAREHGFTEDHLANEKRPGATTKPKEVTTDASQTSANAFNLLARGEIVYTPAQGFEGHYKLGTAEIAALPSLPMINTAAGDDLRQRDYGTVQRPRQDISGTPYQDRTQSSNTTELINQAAQTSEFNKSISQQRMIRGGYLEESWRRKHEVTPSEPTEHLQNEEATISTHISQNYQSPSQMRPSVPLAAPRQQPNATPNQPTKLVPSLTMEPQAYQQYVQQQQLAPAQSPARMIQQAMRPEHVQHRAPSYTYGTAGAIQAQNPMYGYQQAQMWPPLQLHASPHAQQQHMPQYPNYPHQPQQHQSPHPQHQQSPHHQVPPQLPLSQSTGPMQGNQINYQVMGNMATQSGYPGMTTALYQQSSPGPQQYLPQPSADQQTRMQGWAPSPSNQEFGQGQHGWPNF